MSSDRPLTSCSECTRRKTRCDKLTPCGACVKRKVSHLCRVPQKEKGVPPPPPSKVESLKLASFGEIAAIRVSVDGLRGRLGALETFLQKTFEMAAGADGDLPTLEQEEAQQHGGGESEEPPSENGGREAMMGEELEASVNLEFAALGRTRMFGEGQGQVAESAVSPGIQLSNAGSQSATAPFSDDPELSSPSAAPSQPSVLFYSSSSALLAASPSQAQSDALIKHALEWTSWHHAAIYIQGFNREHREFWSWGESRIESCDPLWLALYFAQLTAGLKHLTRAQAASMGYRPDDVHILAKRWFDCSMAALYRGHFLENHSLFTVQTVVVLLYTAQDSGTTNIFSTLLNAGMATALDLGLHRMVSDAEWEQSMAGRSSLVRGRSLIDREIKKRAFWALVAQDWFSIAYRSTYSKSIQPSQIKSPLALNAHDSDLAAGIALAQPASTYTLCGTLLIWISIAQVLFTAFQHLQSGGLPSYQFLLEADSRLQSIIDGAPLWLVDGGPSENMPPPVEWIRRTFRISSAHKILTLHRPFLARSFQDKRYKSSRTRAILASRKILREAEMSTGSRLWTIPYHVSAAACVVALDLFQQIGTNTPALDEERQELRSALSALRTMQELSPIATRGVALVSKLLEEEARLRAEAFLTAPPSLKRSRGGEDEKPQTLTKMARRLGNPAEDELIELQDRRASLSFMRTELSQDAEGYQYPADAAPAPSSSSHNSPLDVLNPDYMKIFFSEANFDPLQGAFAPDHMTSPDMFSFGGTYVGHQDNEAFLDWGLFEREHDISVAGLPGQLY